MDSNTTPTTVEVNGFAFREIRIRSGVDAGPCAAAAGIDRSYLSRLETGARVRVSPSTLARLLEALQIRDRRAILADPHGTPSDATETEIGVA
ncbi:helix-turn-helix transcriptional regulator [Actinocorallia longicatena]|uniref:HTH cro/C1-type domain-containing protein n=1 Tax=Actinocorallia longicatena TaxID=111803 RepID=A0ABP6QLB1_9ACTN